MVSWEGAEIQFRLIMKASLLGHSFCHLRSVSLHGPLFVSRVSERDAHCK
jgi:hypothetical protein